MKSALAIWGGWDGHQPKETTAIFADFLRQEGYAVTVTDSLDALLDVESLKKQDVLLLCWTMGSISPEQLNGLQEAVKSGVGLAGWHGGLCDAFRGNLAYEMMTGGQFIDHPGGIIDYTVNITQPQDPIVQGLRDFSMRSEQYFMHVDPGNEVLATTTFGGDMLPWIEGTVMPVVWKRRFGAGRIFYSALGHVVGDFDVPECLEIQKRGILWASR